MEDLKKEEGKLEREIGNVFAFAISKNYVEFVKFLINMGVDVDARDDVGMTPLMWAAYYGNVEIAKLLLDNGADVNARSGLC